MTLKQLYLNHHAILQRMNITKTNEAERNWAIFEAREAGKELAELAREHGITIPAIQRICGRVKRFLGR